MSPALNYWHYISRFDEPHPQLLVIISAVLMSPALNYWPLYQPF